MPYPITTKSSASLSTYQNFDGSNLTIGGLEEGAASKRGYAGAFIGVGTDFNSDAMLVIDLKGKMNYDDNGILNQNLRVRNTIGLNSSATQIRYSPLSVEVPLNKNFSFYANPHYSGKYDYRNDKWTNSAGIFAGFTQKIGKNTSVSIEAQRYNLQDINDNSGKNWGINAIVSYNF